MKHINQMVKKTIFYNLKYNSSYIFLKIMRIWHTNCIIIGE